MKDALSMAVTVVVGFVIFCAGLMLGMKISNDVTKNDCRGYGKHVMGEYMLICEKRVSP